MPCTHPLIPGASSQHPSLWHRPLPSPSSRTQAETAEPEGRAHCPSSSHPCPSGGAAGSVSAMPSRPPSSRPVRASSVGSSVSLQLAGAGNAARMCKAGWPASGVGGPGAGAPGAPLFYPGQRQGVHSEERPGRLSTPVSLLLSRSSLVGGSLGAPPGPPLPRAPLAGWELPAVQQVGVAESTAGLLLLCDAPLETTRGKCDLLRALPPNPGGGAPMVWLPPCGQGEGHPSTKCNRLPKYDSC